jgi:hypothetical protein
MRRTGAIDRSRHDLPVPNPTGTMDKPISARLLRRLAAAADGFRNGLTVWFTANYEPEGEDESFKISKAIVQDDPPTTQPGPGRKHFGPYKSTGEPIRTTPIVEIVLHVQTANGIQTVSIPAKDYDAIFWSTSALEKFAIPHYVVFEGLKRAAKLEKKFKDDASVYAIVHGPNTEYSTRPVDAVPAGMLPVKIISI